MYQITNDAGRAFNVRVVRKGDTYGLNDCLTYGSEGGSHSSCGAASDAAAARGEVLVEFYDATYANHPASRGQFVARYYLSTLKERSSAWLRPPGLCLHGGVPEWVISGRNLAEAVAYAVGSVQEAA